MAMNWKSVRRAMDRDALLERLGLERRTPASDFFTGLGLFSIGVLVGAGLGVIFTPKRGEEVRSALNEAWKNRSRLLQREMGGGAVSQAQAAEH